jgi:hypothetical protein
MFYSFKGSNLKYFYFIISMRSQFLIVSYAVVEQALRRRNWTPVEVFSLANPVDHVALADPSVITWILPQTKSNLRFADVPH